MVVGTALGLTNLASVVLAVVLAFFLRLRAYADSAHSRQHCLGTALGLAFASDTASITIMEIVDNAIMLIIPGAMNVGLTSALFWASLAVSLAVAGAAAFPVNRWLIARGRGHAVLHQYH